MNRTTVMTAALLLSTASVAQVVPAAKNAGKATAETALQVKERVEGAVVSEPSSSVHKAKAKVHEAKAKSDATAAKDAAKAIAK